LFFSCGGDEGSDDAEEASAENGGGEKKKDASKIGTSYLSSFLADISVSLFNWLFFAIN
jgi:hypothetical protein